MMKARKLLVVMAGAAMPFMGNASILWDMQPYNIATPGGTVVALNPYDGSFGPTLLKVTLVINGSMGGLFTLTSPTPQTFTVSFSGSVQAQEPTSGLTANAAGAIAPNPTVIPGLVGVNLLPLGFGLTGSASDTYPVDPVWTSGPINVTVTDTSAWSVDASGNGTGDVSGLGDSGYVEMWIDVPEPEHYALFAGLGMLGFLAIRRRMRA